MVRRQRETFSQDRLGNVNRDLDEIRSRDGMEEGDGLIEVTDEDTGTDTEAPATLIVAEVPGDARALHLTDIHVNNTSGAAGELNVYSLQIDYMEGGDSMITGETRRSIPYTVEGQDHIEYKGKGFEDEAIAITADFTGFVGLSYYTDRPEELEPSVEQLGTGE